MKESPKHPAEGGPSSTLADGSGAPPAPPRRGGDRPLELPVIDAERYTLEGEHGRGGLGLVLRGFDRRLGRWVAIKQVLASSPRAEARLVREALITARLQHPSIVPVMEAGRFRDGAPFYAMKLVAGRALSEIVAGTRGLDERLALVPNVIAVADAIAYAHGERVIHRDLKPSNVIVGDFGETVVIDWGLAKDLDAGDGPAETEAFHDAAAAQLTGAGAVMGTPAYMAPEQAAGGLVDERTDVYALGALLFHVLAGAPPPSHVVPALATLEAGVPADLATIVGKATALEPAARYRSARELASELRRFQTGQLVEAHRYGRTALLRRWLRRHRAAALVGGLLSVALAVTTAVGVSRTVRERDRAEGERARAEQRAQDLTLVQARTSLRHDPTASMAWLKTARLDAESRAEAAAIALDARERGVARQVWPVRGSVNDVAVLADGRHAVASGTMDAVLEWDLTAGALVGRYPVTLRVRRIAAMGDGRRLVGQSDFDELMVIDRDARAVRTVAGRGQANALRVTHDGRAVVTGDFDGTVRLWRGDLATPSVVVRLPELVRDLELAPDDSWLAAIANDGVLRIIDATTGRERRLGEVGDGPFRLRVWVSPRGGRIVTMEPVPRLRSWEVATGQARTLLDKQGEITAGAFVSEDEFASATDDGAVRIWDLRRGTSRQLKGRVGYVNFLAVSPDRRHLVTCGDDAVVRHWDLATGFARSLHGHRSAVLACRYSADGRTIVSGGNDASVRVWTAPGSPQTVMIGHDEDVYHVAWAPDGAHLASGDVSGVVRLWQLDTGHSVMIDGHTAEITALAFLGGGQRVASASSDASVLVSDLAGNQVARFGHASGVESMVATRDGRTLVTGDVNGDVRVWDVAAGTALVLRGHRTTVRRVALSADERLVVAGADDGSVRVWPRAGGDPPRVLVGHRERVTGVAFGDGDRVVASASWDGTVRTWRVATGASLHVWRASADRLMSLEVSPDRRRLVAGGHDHAARVWDLTGGGELRLWHDDAVGAAVFSPDGRRIVTVGDDAVARSWDAGTGRLLGERRADEALTDAQFSPTGDAVALVGWDSALRVWRFTDHDQLPATAAELPDWIEAMTTALIGAANQPVSPRGDASR